MEYSIWTIIWGILVYSIGIKWLERRGIIPKYIRSQGPIHTIHTERGRRLLEKLASPKRFWKVWGNVGVFVASLVMIATFLLLISSASMVIQNPTPTAFSQPKNMLIIPGINEFLPWKVAVYIFLGLIVGLVVHEGGHGIMCRVENIKVKTMGLALFTVLPIGAFVEPDEDSIKKAKRVGQMRMFSGGVANNFFVALICFLLLFGPISGGIGIEQGIAVGGVFPGSPAEQAGILDGDRIVGTEKGILFESWVVERRGSDEIQMVTVDRRIGIVGMSSNGPYKHREVVMGYGNNLVIEGVEVQTIGGLEELIRAKDVVLVQIGNEEAQRIPMGALVNLVEDGPWMEEDKTQWPPLGHIVVTSINGVRVVDSDGLTGFLKKSTPKTVVEIEYYERLESENRWVKSKQKVQLGEHPNAQIESGFLGVISSEGFSGIEFDDVGIVEYPAEVYLQMLGGGDVVMANGKKISFGSRVMLALQLPVISVVSANLPFNFAGFTADNTNFYSVKNSLKEIDWVVFKLANILFWTGWINFNLGLFNCIPTAPLDGGHILRKYIEIVTSRLSKKKQLQVVNFVCGGVSVIMVMCLVVVIFGPSLLSG